MNSFMYSFGQKKQHQQNNKVKQNKCKIPWIETNRQLLRVVKINKRKNKVKI